MSNPLTRRTQSLEARGNPYERFGLSQNPFPDSPVIVPDAGDPRLNGEIFQADLRQDEQEQFERLLILSSYQPEPRSIAFLMDYATRRGRGIGKTAFLNYQRRRIMTDLGDDLTDGAYVLMAAHLFPEGGGRTRKFWHFTRLIGESLVRGGCVAWAIWRLRAFSGMVPEEVLKEVDPFEPGSSLGDDRWLDSRGVGAMFTLDPVVEKVLRQAGVHDEIARMLAQHGLQREHSRRSSCLSKATTGGDVTVRDLSSTTWSTCFDPRRSTEQFCWSMR